MVTIDEIDSEIGRKSLEAFNDYISKGLPIPLSLRQEIAKLQKKKQKMVNASLRAPPVIPTPVDTSHDNETVPGDQNTYGPSSGSDPQPIDASSIEDSNYQAQQASSNQNQGGPQDTVPQPFHFQNYQVGLALLAVGLWIYCKYQ